MMKNSLNWEGRLDKLDLDITTSVRPGVSDCSEELIVAKINCFLDMILRKARITTCQLHFLYTRYRTKKR